jgi:hypothetical protein
MERFKKILQTYTVHSFPGQSHLQQFKSNEKKMLLFVKNVKVDARASFLPVAGEALTGCGSVTLFSNTIFDS